MSIVSLILVFIFKNWIKFCGRFSIISISFRFVSLWINSTYRDVNSFQIKNQSFFTNNNTYVWSMMASSRSANRLQNICWPNIYLSQQEFATPGFHWISYILTQPSDSAHRFSYRTWLLSRILRLFGLSFIDTRVRLVLLFLASWNIE